MTSVTDVVVTDTSETSALTIAKLEPIPSRRDWAVTGLVTLVALCLGVSSPALADPKPKIKFDIMRSAAATSANCAADATGRVKITSLGPVEEMDVEVSGLPPNTEFDFFVIQLPDAPFGLAWYQGDIETDDEGEGHQSFRGRFNIETFIVAQPPGGQAAPVVHNQPPFPDASTNPATEPVHTFHLGLWFGSPEAAEAAGCPKTVTRFNGEHNAGIQVLSTRNFLDLMGPLQQLTP
jgi:hypothetical protein